MAVSKEFFEALNYEGSRSERCLCSGVRLRTFVHGFYPGAIQLCLVDAVPFPYQRSEVGALVG